MDNEIKGEGNSLNFKFRMYDPRVGRFFATDPLERQYSYLSPYHFSHNSPIYTKEIEGLEGIIPSYGMEYSIPHKRGMNAQETKKFHEALKTRDKANAMGAITGVGIWAAGIALYEFGIWMILNPITAGEIINETTAVTWSLVLDEPYPGPAVGDDAANLIKLTIKGLVDSKVVAKFIIPLGKLNYALGEGTTVTKDLAKMTIREIENMAKSIIRSKKFKENGVETTEDMARLAVEAFDEGAEVGVRIINEYGEIFKKQISLVDGTKVNVNFIIKEGEDIPTLTSFSIPEVNKKELGGKIKELKEKAIDAGNELLNKL